MTQNNDSATRGRCPSCGRSVKSRLGRVPFHKTVGQQAGSLVRCEGTGQIPRSLADRRPLWETA